MSYYKTCPYCGAHLDSGESCDCIGSLYASLSVEDRAAVDAKITELLQKKKAAWTLPTSRTAKRNRLNELIPSPS